MAFADKTLTCVQCGNSFVFTASEQELHRTRGYTNEPKRCPTCREARRSERQWGGGYEGSYRVSRRMFPVVCAECGTQTEVPFEPRGDRPVYCSDCFRKTRQPRTARY
ncbi:MAG: zinc-ribbon domain containing protein [Chloroflexi bacterium]|nr:zinc-ribbon domain containing protein [Chloroflexota bacterium]